MPVSGVPELLNNLSKFSEEKVNAVYQATAAVQAIVVNEARERCPVHTTTLLKSIQAGVVTVTDKMVSAEVKAEAEYASYLELGTRPHFPPVSELEEWAEKKLGDRNLAWAVARAIARRGTPPKPFLGPAVQANQKAFFRAVKEAMKT